MGEDSKVSDLSNLIRIDDDRVNIVRGTVEETLNAMLDAEADRLCNAGRYERSEARRDFRSGKYERKLGTKAGLVRLQVPKLRRQTFETAVIERYRRRETSVEGWKRRWSRCTSPGYRCGGLRTSPTRCGDAGEPGHGFDFPPVSTSCVRQAARQRKRGKGRSSQRSCTTPLTVYGDAAGVDFLRTCRHRRSTGTRLRPHQIAAAVAAVRTICNPHRTAEAKRASAKSRRARRARR